MKVFVPVLGIALALTLAAGPAGAQEKLDPNLFPSFGMTNLKAGFTPDPFAKNLTAGGVIKTNMGGVNTNVAKAPDFRLTYSAGNIPLTIHVDSRSDTTLLIRQPNGQWVANDDGPNGLNPLVKFVQPMSGRYDIYVGTVKAESAPATLLITEHTVSVDAPNPGLPAAYGSAKLKIGFVPDPFVRPLTAGGSIKTKLGGVNAHVARAPDFTLEYTAGNLPLTIRAESKADTTLLINLPNGAWVANDDGNEGAGQARLNPVLRFPQPASGRYDIYVGTVGTDSADATLYITERK